MSSSQGNTQETMSHTIQIRVIPNPKKKPKHKIITIITNREKPKRKPRTSKKEAEAKEKEKEPVTLTAEEQEKAERLLKRQRAQQLGKLKQKGAILVTVDPSKTIPMLLKDALLVKVNPNKSQPVINQVNSINNSMGTSNPNSNMVKKCEVIKIDENDDLFESCNEWTKWIKHEQAENSQDKK